MNGGGIHFWKETDLNLGVMNLRTMNSTSEETTLD